MAEKDDEQPELPRGASPSELDALRAAVKVSPRVTPPVSVHR